MMDEAIARAEARPGDRLSVGTQRGRRGPADPRHAGQRQAPPGAARRAAPAVARQLADRPLAHTKGEGEGVTVIYKQPGMSDGGPPTCRGTATAAWAGIDHKARRCCSVCICARRRRRAASFAMLPGSHRASFAHDRRSTVAS